MSEDTQSGLIWGAMAIVLSIMGIGACLFPVMFVKQGLEGNFGKSDAQMTVILLVMSLVGAVVAKNIFVAWCSSDIGGMQERQMESRRADQAAHDQKVADINAERTALGLDPIGRGDIMS